LTDAIQKQKQVTVFVGMQTFANHAMSFFSISQWIGGLLVIAAVAVAIAQDEVWAMWNSLLILAAVPRALSLGQ
jgi:hypothetical protein